MSGQCFCWPFTCIYWFWNSFPIYIMTGYWAAFPVLYNNSLFINICIPQSASLICMFLINPLPCGGHSLSGLWGCESLVNTVVMKDSRTSPGGSQGDCPPAQRPCSAPQLRGSCSPHHPEGSLQTGKTHPPSGSGFTGVFLLGDFYSAQTSIFIVPF